MPYVVSVVRGRLFVDDFPVVISSHIFYRCRCRSCPYSVSITRVVVDGRTTYKVEYVVFGQHCHVFKQNKRSQTKTFVESELELIKSGMDKGGVLDEKHKMWQQKAVQEGQELRERLLKQETAVAMAVENPNLSGRVIERASGNVMDHRAITMAGKRKREKEEDSSLKDIIKSKNIIFSRMTARKFSSLATTRPSNGLQRRR